MNNELKSSPDQDGFFTKLLRFAAYPVGAVAGWWVARNQIRHYTFMKLRNLGGLEGLPEQGEHTLKSAMKDAVAHAQHHPGAVVDVVKDTRVIEHEYTAAIRTRMKQLGLDSVTKQAEFIYKPQFHKAMLEGVTAATIGIGALLVIANSKALTRALHNIADNKKDGTPSVN